MIERTALPIYRSLYLLFIEMWWKTDVVKKNAKKTNFMTFRCHFYLELENIKIRHQVMYMFPCITKLKYFKVF